jgi:hypothetical protein
MTKKPNKIPKKYTAKLSRRDKSKQKKNKRRKKVKITKKKMKKIKNRKIQRGGMEAVETPSVVGPGPRTLEIHFGIVTHQTIGDCIKELIEASYNIYNELIGGKYGRPATIICGGQSPSYYCLAMMNFKIYNPDVVNIIILPHSKSQQKSEDQVKENTEYCERLKEEEIELNRNVVIIDGVHSGTGILALESALKHCYQNIRVAKIAINETTGIAKIPVNEEIIVPCEWRFSDTFPRLVESFHPRDFRNKEKFINAFINLESNPVAEMIIDIAKDYHPKFSVEDTEWFLLNNEVTPEIQGKKDEFHRQREIDRQIEMGRGEKFTPLVLTNPKRYQCPLCKQISGILATLNPESRSPYFVCAYNCPNKFKIPV